MRFVIAAFLAVTALTSGARGEEVRTATWFADHPEARAKVDALCKDNPGEAKHEPNCDNAFQGNVIAATRAAQVQSNNGGVSDLGGSGAYWKDPANAQNRAFWLRQCKIAESKGAAQQTLNGMWCPEIEAGQR
jgi:hypothetical protein